MRARQADPHGSEHHDPERREGGAPLRGASMRGKRRRQQGEEDREARGCPADEGRERQQGDDRQAGHSHPDGDLRNPVELGGRSRSERRDRERPRQAPEREQPDRDDRGGDRDRQPAPEVGGEPRSGLATRLRERRLAVRAAAHRVPTAQASAGP